MMRTSLYLPFIGFTINGQDGNKQLVESIVQSGPACQLIVHESESWLKIRDELGDNNLIKIISKKDEEEYKKLSYKYFEPITSRFIDAPTSDGLLNPRDNITAEYRRALSYILIAHDYKARIYDDDILEEDYNLSQIIKPNRDYFSQDDIDRVVSFEKLLYSYKKDKIDAISISSAEGNLSDILDFLDDERIKRLSEKHALFGRIVEPKEVLKRQIKLLTGQIVKEGWGPVIINAPTLALSYFDALPKEAPLVSFLATIGLTLARRYDFSEYIPPIQNNHIWSLMKGNMGVFTYAQFNHEYKFPIIAKNIP